MAGEPNELPEGGEGGGGFIFGGIRGERPAELPQFNRVSEVNATLLREVLQLRSRMHELENQQIISSFRANAGSAVAFLPNELPEGGEGGGGIGGVRGEFPGEFPAELPAFNDLATHIDARMSALETRVSAALDGIQAQLKSMGQ